MIITGDLNQSDLNPTSNGLLEIYNKLRNSDKKPDKAASGCVRYVELEKEDVQRSRAAKTMLDIWEMKPVVEAKKYVPEQPVLFAPIQYDENNLCSNEFEYFDLNNLQNSTTEWQECYNSPTFSTVVRKIRESQNVTTSVDESPEEKNVEWIDISNSDAALIPLKHIKELRNFKEE